MDLEAQLEKHRTTSSCVASPPALLLQTCKKWNASVAQRRTQCTILYSRKCATIDKGFRTRLNYWASIGWFQAYSRVLPAHIKITIFHAQIFPEILIREEASGVDLCFRVGTTAHKDNTYVNGMTVQQSPYMRPRLHRPGLRHACNGWCLAGSCAAAWSASSRSAWTWRQGQSNCDASDDCRWSTQSGRATSSSPLIHLALCGSMGSFFPRD